MNQSLDLVFTIKRLVEAQKLNIYTQNKGQYGTKGWYYISYNEELERNLRDSLIYNKHPYFEISYQLDTPLINIYGEDSIVLDDSGNYFLLYPAPIYYVFPARECDEIRIKEERFYNEMTKKYEFKPVGLSFYFKGNNFYRGHEKFWVDLNELFAVLENKKQYPWYNAIISKKYQGFQYMQTSCYDEEIKE